MGLNIRSAGQAFQYDSTDGKLITLAPLTVTFSEDVTTVETKGWSEGATSAIETKEEFVTERKGLLSIEMEDIDLVRLGIVLGGRERATQTSSIMKMSALTVPTSPTNTITVTGLTVNQKVGLTLPSSSGTQTQFNQVEVAPAAVGEFQVTANTITLYADDVTAYEGRTLKLSKRESTEQVAYGGGNPVSFGKNFSFMGKFKGTKFAEQIIEIPRYFFTNGANFTVSPGGDAFTAEATVSVDSDNGFLDYFIIYPAP